MQILYQYIIARDKQNCINSINTISKKAIYLFFSDFFEWSAKIAKRADKSKKQNILLIFHKKYSE